MTVHYDTRPEDIEVAFVTAINVVAKKHGCKLIDCDFERKYIEIEGPEEAQLKVALAIDLFMHQWEIPQYVSDGDIEDIKGTIQ